MKLTDIARVIRSKNSGPFELTLDIMFNDEEHYRHCVTHNVITRELMARLYDVPVEDILHIVHFEPAHAIKITMKRWIPSGNRGDSDIYGAQQHAPLLGLEV